MVAGSYDVKTNPMVRLPVGTIASAEAEEAMSAFYNEVYRYIIHGHTEANADVRFIDFFHPRRFADPQR